MNLCMHMLVLLLFAGALAAAEPPFADYVRDTKDFQWKSRTDGSQLEVTSQIWHGAVWRHTVNLTPGRNAPDLCVIFVEGSENLPEIARRTGVGCASVGGIYPACHGQAGGEGISLFALQQCAKTGDPTPVSERWQTAYNTVRPRT